MSNASKQKQFKPGNNAWESRQVHGRRAKFDSARILELACESYFEWVDSNPLHRIELVKHQGKATQYKVPVHRPMTLTGLCLHLQISRRTWTNYRRQPDLLHITERVEAIIYVQKLEGAAVGIFDARLIARQIGNRHVQ